MTDDKRCPAVYTPILNIKYQCMLYDGHDEDHMWYITWGGEHEGDLME